MVFPFPRIFFSFKKIPMTWLLIFINVFLFIAFLPQNNNFSSSMSEIIEDKYFYKTQAVLYKSYVENHPEFYGYFTKNILKLDWDSPIKSRIISSFAISDTRFTDNIFHETPIGDAVAYQFWKKDFNRLLELQETSPNYSLGVFNQSSAINYITYQFMHASFGHLLSNMIFLLLFGALIEPLFGSLLLLITYLASGVIAAQSFLMVSESINSPLIGASGAISGLMALYCVAAFKKNIRYFYFLFIPRPEYMGFVYLPSWLLFVFWFMSDLSGYFSQVSEHSGVAYVAHLGGQLAGALVALTMLFLWKYFKRKEGQIKNIEAFGKVVPLTQVIEHSARKKLNKVSL